MYYGGEPPTWTKVPDLPEDAKYETMSASSDTGDTQHQQASVVYIHSRY